MPISAAEAYLHNSSNPQTKNDQSLASILILFAIPALGRIYQQKLAESEIESSKRHNSRLMVNRFCRREVVFIGYWTALRL